MANYVEKVIACREIVEAEFVATISELPMSKPAVANALTRFRAWLDARDPWLDGYFSAFHYTLEARDVNPILQRYFISLIS